MRTITLKGREIPLIMTTWELKQMQEEICKVEILAQKIAGRNPENDEDTSGFGTPEHLDVIAKAVRIMGNAGLEETGQEADLTEKKILRALKPVELFPVANACIDAINEGWASEIPDVPEDRPRGRVDKGLREMKKKGDPAD